MADLDDRLKALWVGRKREDPLFDIDEMGLAAWFDAGCPENEAIDSWLSNDPASRETLDFLLEEARSTRPQPSAETIESLQGSILGHLRESSAGRRRRPVLASIDCNPWRLPRRSSWLLWDSRSASLRRLRPMKRPTTSWQP